MQAHQLTESQYNIYLTEVSQRVLAPLGQQDFPVSAERLQEISPHPQVTQFVLFQIFQDWSNHMNQLRHEYFNYNAPAVQQALNHLQNVLSHHISLERPQLKQLLDKATFNSLKLLLQPNEMLNRFFFRSRDSLPLDIFIKYARFFDDFDFLVQGVVQIHKQNGEQEVTKQRFQQLIRELGELYAQKTGQDLEAYRRERFRNLTGADLDKVLPRGSQRPASPMGYNSTPNSPHTPNNPTTESDQPERLADRFAHPTGNLNSRYGGRQAMGPAQIPAFKRFQFVNHFFQGDEQSFEESLNHLNSLPGPQEVEDTLEQLAVNLGVGKNDEALWTEFRQLALHRFRG